jgi:hypothetical protein
MHVSRAPRRRSPTGGGDHTSAVLDRFVVALLRLPARVKDAIAALIDGANRAT